MLLKLVTYVIIISNSCYVIIISNICNIIIISNFYYVIVISNFYCGIIISIIDWEVPLTGCRLSIYSSRFLLLVLYSQL